MKKIKLRTYINLALDFYYYFYFLYFIVIQVISFGIYRFNKKNDDLNIEEENINI